MYSYIYENYEKEVLETFAARNLPTTDSIVEPDKTAGYMSRTGYNIDKLMDADEKKRNQKLFIV